MRALRLLNAQRYCSAHYFKIYTFSLLYLEKNDFARDLKFILGPPFCVPLISNSRYEKFKYTRAIHALSCLVKFELCVVFFCFFAASVLSVDRTSHLALDMLGRILNGRKSAISALTRIRASAVLSKFKHPLFQICMRL